MNDLSTTAIASALDTSRQSVIRRAEAERWACRGEGKALRWVTRSLPRDVLGKLVGAGLVDAECPLPSQQGHNDQDTDPEGEFLSVRDKDRDIAGLRAALVGMYRMRETEMNVVDFIELYNAGHASRAIRERLGPVSAPSFYRWLKRHKEGGNSALALIPRYALRDRSSGETMSELARSYLEYFWLRDSRPSMRSAWIELRVAVPEAPSYATAARYLKSLPAILVDYKRRGACKMETLDLPYIERNMALYKAMDQLVSDHHTFDFLVEKEGNLFRPWITAVQDFRSGKIVGYWPSVYPSSLSISLAFYLAISRFGSCKLIHIDNGKDYRSMVLNGATKAMKVCNADGFLEEELVAIQGAYSLFSERVTFARPYHGSSKGRMERTFGTFAQLFSRRMEGYVGSNTVERPEDAALYWRALNKKAKRTDVHSWGDFVLMLASFVDWYNAEWHGEGAGMDGRTPDETFAAESVPMRPVSPEILAMAFSRAERRTVGRDGVRLDGVRYWSDELLAYKGVDVLVRRLIQDPDEVIVSDHKGKRLCKAQARYFLETGNLEADNRRLATTKRKALIMVRDAQDAITAPPEGYRSLIEIAACAHPHEAQPLALAAGAETVPEMAIATQADDERGSDRAKVNSFIDFLGKE